MRGFQIVSSQHRQHPSAPIILPSRGSKQAAGYDFYSPVDISIQAGEVVRIATDIKAYMQPSEVLHIYVRSSIGLRGLMLANTVGIIDADYYGNPSNDGNIIIALRNLGTKCCQLAAGDRFAQGVFMPYLLADGDGHELGEQRQGGYGHTGR